MKKEIDFSKYSSIKIGPVKDVQIINEVMKLPKDSFIVGGANNLLISENPPPLFLLSKKFDFICIEEEYLKVGAATKSGRIFSFAKKHNIKNFEYLGKLPGTLGGLIKMNAGMKEDEIFDTLYKIKTDCGWIDKENISYSYRNSGIDGIIYEALFKLERGFDEKKLSKYKDLRKKQPKEPSAGSVFKNPKNDFAGRLIESVGLKGVKKGDVAFSETHANFLINYGFGTYKGALFLINEAKKRVFEEFGIVLEEEIKII